MSFGPSESYLSLDCTNENSNLRTYESVPFLTDLIDDQMKINANQLESGTRLITLHIDQNQNTKHSLGLELLGRMLIRSVLPESPADKAGLLAGDRILAINGINVAHLSLVDTANMLRACPNCVITLARQLEVSGPNTSNSTTEKCQDGQSSARLSCNSASPCNRYHNQQQANNCDQYDAIHSSLSSPTQCTCNEHQYCNLPPRIIDNIAENCKCVNPTNVATNSHDLEFDATSRSMPTLVEPINNQRQGHRRRIDDNRASSAVTLPSFPSSRRVTLGCDSTGQGIGLVLIGGNKSGVFVDQVDSGSPADNAGIGSGDKIVKINNINVDGWTKEEVALGLLAATDNRPNSRDANRIIELTTDLTGFESVKSNQLTGDDFYIRANFCLTSQGRSELAISIGDIFHVVDTFIDGHFGNWLASRVSPTTSDLGTIPNEKRAKSYLAIVRVSEGSNAGRAISPPALPYERVLQFDAYPWPRPVVIYGPLSDLARRRLTNLTSQEVGFELPPISVAPADAPSMNGHGMNNLEHQSKGLVRLSAVKASMHRGLHCLLDVNLSAVESLVDIGLPPIVVLIKPESKLEMEAVLRPYWRQDKDKRGNDGRGAGSGSTKSLFNSLRRTRSGETSQTSSHQSGEDDPSFTTLVDRIWREVCTIDRDQEKVHLITDRVGLMPASASGSTSFSEVDWLQNLVAVINHQQECPVWLGEESQMTESIKNSLSNNMSKSRHPSGDATPTASPTPRRHFVQQVPQPEPHYPLPQTVSLSNMGKVDARDQSMPLITRPRPPFADQFDNRLDGEFRRPTILAGESFLINNGYDKRAYRNDLYDVRPELLLPVEPLTLESDDPTEEQLPSPPSFFCQKTIPVIQITQARLTDGLLVKVASTSSLSTTDNDRKDIELLDTDNNPRNHDPPITPSNHEDTISDNSFTSKSSKSSKRSNKAIGKSNNKYASSVDQENFVGLATRNGTSVVETTTTPHREDNFESLAVSSMDQLIVNSPATLPSSVSSPKSANSKAILAEASGLFNHQGGRLTIAEYQVKLRIPPGALRGNELKEIFMRVYDHSQKITSALELTKQLGAVGLDDGESPRLISPLVLCGPRGLRFAVPVELIVPRYQLEEEEQVTDDSSLRTNGGDNNEWAISLLHASAGSTSTSAADDTDRSFPTGSNRRRERYEAKWKEIPLSGRTRDSASSSANGISTRLNHSHISILVDHF